MKEKEKEIESDLSLIEIAGEVDSLRPQIHNDDGSHIDKNVSSANKSEISKFSIEPQQMEEKRKGVGYNLRKSLSWNRAFFTEEGLLNPSELSMLSSNLSSSKINQTSQRAIVQKNKMTKSPAINSKSVINKAKAGTSRRSLAPKTSIHDARRNVTGSLPKKNSTILHQQSSTKASLGTGEMPKSACHPLSDQDGGSSKIVVTLPLNTSCTDGNMHESHFQTAKPSGLRMPSPSLQFFSQGKVAAVQSLLQRNDQSKRYEVSNFSNAGTVRLLKHHH